MEKILEVRNLIKLYPPNIRAVNDVSFDLYGGETLTIYGGSGGGKTTLMRLLSGMEKPSDGEILCLEQDIGKMSDAQAAAFRNQHIGVLLPDPALINDLTLLENAMLPLVVKGIETEKARRKAAEYFSVLGVEVHLHSRANSVSRLERFLSGLIRCIITGPKLILTDEFLSGFHKKERARIYDALNAFENLGGCAYVHFTDSRDETTAGKAIQIKDGKLGEAL